MRDFTAGRDIHVGGDIHIHDHSQQPKLLALCSTEELLHERAHRLQLADAERRSRMQQGIAGVVLGVLLLAGFGIWCHFTGKPSLGALLVAIAGLLIPLASIRIFDTPTEFEQRQLTTLKEISYLLRERSQ